MGKNITFTVDARLIDEARAAARADNSSLSEQFRLWLEQYARQRRAANALSVVAQLQQRIDTSGRKFTRAELNERR